jgi:Zn-dependent protease/predicted transcriptional regulator
MFGKRITLFRLLGFDVRIDISWIIIAVLIVWSLSKGLFPFYVKGLSANDYWIMGIAGALGLFMSIVLHEFFHSIIARKYGLPMKGITLFIFGGVAEMSDEPPSAKAEFMMAIAGPVSSILLGFLFYILYGFSKISGGSQVLQGIFGYLAFINFILAAFNLLPAFPLDGGRVLRSILWGIKKNLRWATRISANIGSVFGVLLLIWGVWDIFKGNFIGGMWWSLIGMFLYNAAKGSYQQLLNRKVLEGEPVRRFMKLNPITVPPAISIEEFIETYVYRFHFKMFPVVESGRLLGCITTKQIKKIPKEDWSRKKVGELAVMCSPENTIGPQEDAVKALSIMNQTGSSRLIVMEDDQLIGILSLKDMLEFLALKVELEP